MGSAHLLVSRGTSPFLRERCLAGAERPWEVVALSNGGEDRGGECHGDSEWGLMELLQ